MRSRPPVTRERLLRALRLLGTTRGRLSGASFLAGAKTVDDVRSALILGRERFRFLAKIHHPDVGGDAARFIELTRLREVLDQVTEADLPGLISAREELEEQVNTALVSIYVNGVRVARSVRVQIIDD